MGVPIDALLSTKKQEQHEDTMPLMEVIDIKNGWMQEISLSLEALQDIQESL